MTQRQRRRRLAFRRGRFTLAMLRRAVAVLGANVIMAGLTPPETRWFSLDAS